MVGRGRGRKKATTGSGAAVKGLGDLPPHASRTKTQYRADSLAWWPGKEKWHLLQVPGLGTPASIPSPAGTPPRLANLGVDPARARDSRSPREPGLTAKGLSQPYARREERQGRAAEGTGILPWKRPLSKCPPYSSTRNRMRSQAVSQPKQQSITASIHAESQQAEPRTVTLRATPRLLDVEPGPGWALPPMGLHSPRPSATLALTTCKLRLYVLDLSTGWS